MADWNKEIAKKIEDSINSTSCSPNVVALHLSRMHRYLQNEFYKICKAYMHILAENYNKGYYDPRNEYACKDAHRLCSFDEEWEKKFWKDRIEEL